MTYQTTTKKCYHGWQAESHASLGQTSEGEQMLVLITAKRSHGILSASARVYNFHYDADGELKSKTTILFQDYRKRDLCVTPCKRVTEKAVLQVHKQALLLMPDLIEQAKAYYIELEAA